MLTIRNDVTKVKEINVELIKSAMKTCGNATKAEIAEYTGISVATCGKILNDLCGTGEVREVSVLSGGYGRPAKSYAYNASFALVACIYVATDQNQIILSHAVGNLLGDVIENETREIEYVDYQILEDCAGDLLARHGLIKSIVVGIPGYVTGDVVGLCNFTALMDLPLCRRLQDKFPQVKMSVENDMNAAAYGFYKSSWYEKDSGVGFIYAPVGARTGVSAEAVFSENAEKMYRTAVTVGAGFVSEGHILRGYSGFAGEVAFLPSYSGAEEEPVVSEAGIVNIIASITAILNPEVVALSGGFFTEENVRGIRERCLSMFAAKHLPKIILRSDLHTDYIQGLICLALEQISCGVALVQKRI